MKTLLALLLTVSPALADMDLPPSRYDIGGTTEVEVLDNFHEMFGNVVKFKRLAPYQVLNECNDLWAARHFREWSAFDGSQLLGCEAPTTCPSVVPEIPCEAETVIVYPYDPADPGLAPQILRHEIGHYIGWPGTHER